MSNNTTIYKNQTNIHGDPMDDNFDMVWTYLYVIIFILCYDMIIKQYIKNYVKHEFEKYEEDRFTEISTIRRTEAEI